MRSSRRVLGLAAGVATLALITVVFAGVAVHTSRNTTANADTPSAEQRTVTVSGDGSVSLTPDTVYITVGVDELNADLATAQANAATKMDAIIAALKSSGVAEQDIQTSGYSIYMERDYNQPSQPITGYHVAHTVNAKVRDISKAGATLAAAVDAGANNIQNVSFGLDNQGDALRQARQLAVANAKDKAQQLAQLSDATLGQVISISESSYGSTPVPYAAYNSAGAADAKSAIAPDINPGQTQVQLTVQVTYALN